MQKAAGRGMREIRTRAATSGRDHTLAVSPLHRWEPVYATAGAPLLPPAPGAASLLESIRQLVRRALRGG